MDRVYIAIFEVMGSPHWVEVLPTYKESVTFIERQICRRFDRLGEHEPFDKILNHEFNLLSARCSWCFETCTYHVLERRVRAGADDITPMTLTWAFGDQEVGDGSM